MTSTLLVSALDLHHASVRAALARYLADVLRFDGRGVRRGPPSDRLVRDALDGFALGVGIAEAVEAEPEDDEASD